MKVELKSVDEYIRTFPKEIQTILKNFRTIILENAPNAVESISYGMPAYKINGKPLVYFAAFKNHIGFYATPTGHSEFYEELSNYKHGKGSVQLPFDHVPYELVKRIVIFKAGENNKIKSNNGR